MTINQLTFNTPSNDIISIAFELEQFIKHDTSDFEIEQTLSNIGETLEKHFQFYRDTKKAEETARVQKQLAQAELEKEKAAASQKTAKVFSSFKNKPTASVAQPAPTTLGTATVESVISVLQNLGLLSPSHLPDVYRFQGSSYAYTVKNNTWFSPFGEDGTGAKSFLTDITKRVFKMEEDEAQAFMKKFYPV